MNFLQLRTSEQETIIASLMEHAFISAEESPSWDHFFTDFTLNLFTIVIELDFDTARQSMAIVKDDHTGKHAKWESIARHFSLNREENDVHRFMIGALFCIALFARVPEEMRYLVWKLFMKSTDATHMQFMHDFLTVSIRDPQAVYGGYATDEVSDDYLAQAEERATDFEDVSWVFTVE